MNVEEVCRLALPKCTEGFSPVYVLETDIDATSLIKRAWKRDGDHWGTIGTDILDEQIGLMAGSAKIKYFVKERSLHCFVNDRSIRYVAHFVVEIEALN